MTKRCYVSYMANDRDIKGILLTNYLLKKYNSPYPYFCFVTKLVSDKVKRQLAFVNIKPINVDFHGIFNQYTINPDITEYLYSKFYYGKLFIFLFNNFDECIYLDSDLLLLKNIDHLFDKLKDTDSKTMFMVPDMHQISKNKNNESTLLIRKNQFNSGVIVFRPNQEIFSNIMQYLKTFTLDRCKQEIITDQSVFDKLHQTNQITIKPLHFIYNIMPRAIQCMLDHKKIVKESDICVIHYILNNKPWDTIYLRPYNNHLCYKYIIRWLQMYQLFVEDFLICDKCKYTI